MTVVCAAVDAGDIGTRGGGEKGGVNEAETEVGAQVSAQGARLVVEDAGVGAAAVEAEDSWEMKG